MKNENLIIVRGGGDIATGIIQKLHRAKFDVLVLEIDNPSSIRRSVSLSECVYTGTHIVEDMIAVKVNSYDEALKAFEENKIPVLVDTKCKILKTVEPIALIDAILAKKNLGTKIDMAPVVIGVGPGFEVDKDCHCIIETSRGHNLGRLLFKGSASPNTGIPGNIAGEDIRRVLRSPAEGNIKVYKKIGDSLKLHELIATVNDIEVTAPFEGLLRGIIPDNFYVTKGFKIGDIDPRFNQYNNCFTISDKARNIGGGALEAILYLKK